MTTNPARHTYGVVGLGAVYVDFAGPYRAVHRTEQIHPTVLLDLDENDALIGVELLDVPGTPRIEVVPAHAQDYGRRVESAGVRLIRQIHVANAHGYCVVCRTTDGYDYEPYPWPCPTLVALGPEPKPIFEPTDPESE